MFGQTQDLSSLLAGGPNIGMAFRAATDQGLIVGREGGTNVKGARCAKIGMGKDIQGL